MPKLSHNASKTTKMTPAGEIPVDWTSHKLGELLEQPVSGVSVLAQETTPTEFELGVLRLSCVTDGTFDPWDLKMPEKNQRHRLSVFAEADTILISRSNTPNLVGASAYVARDYPKSFLPDTLWLLRPKNRKHLSMRWLSYLIRSDDYRKNLQNIASGTSQSMKKIQKGAFLNLLAPVPPLPEQRKIADILSTWDEALETLDALIAAKTRQKQALMQQLLTGKTRVKGFDHSGGKTKSDRFGIYPADWNRVSLAEIIDEVSAKNAVGESLPVLSCTKHRGLVLSQEYFGKRVHAEDTSRYRVVRRGEFAYATNHIEEGSIGYQNLVDAGLVSPIYTVFKTKGEIDDNYLFRVLKSPLLIHFYQINTSASVDRRGSLRFDEFSKIRIWIPSKSEQQQIAAILDTADQELTLLRTQRQTLDQQKRGLMQRLLTGRIRVNLNNLP